MRRSWKISALIASAALVLGFLATCTGSTETTPSFTAAISSPSSDETIAAGTAVSFTGSASGGTEPYVYAWNFDSTGLGAGPAPATGSNPGAVTFNGAHAYVVKLTVTDAANATASASVTVTVNPGSGAISTSKVAGTWMMACSPDDTFNTLGSRREVLKIGTDSSYTNQQYLWASSDHCDGPPQVFMQSSGTMSIYGTTSTTGYGSATQGLENTTAETLALYDAGLVSRYNTASAYGYSTWAQGVAQNVLGRAYSGTRATSVKVLVMREGDVFFLGADDAGTGSYPTSVEPRFILAANDPVTPTALHSANASNEWTGSCVVKSDGDFNATARLDRLYFNTGVTPALVTATTTYFHQGTVDAPTACETIGGSAVVQAVETKQLQLSLHDTATVLTDRGMATAADGTITQHSITPYTRDAADALNTGQVYGITTYASGSEQSIPVEASYDGTTGTAAQKLSVVLQAGRSYVYGDTNSTENPLSAGRYPLFSGSEGYLPRKVMNAVGDFVGNWVLGCEDEAGDGYSSLTHALRIYANGQMSANQTTYTGPGCTGTATVTSLFTWKWGTIVTGLTTPRGYATGIQLSDAQDANTNPECMVLMRTGDRLYATEPQTPAGAACAVGDFAAFNASHGMPQTYAGLEIEPVQTGTIPAGSWRRACRNEGDNDSRDYARTFGVAGNAGYLLTSWTVDYDSTDGSCSGTPTLADPATLELKVAGWKTFSHTGLDVTEFDQVNSAGVTRGKQIMSFYSIGFWTGDESADTLDENGYPNAILPGLPMLRIQ